MAIKGKEGWIDQRRVRHDLRQVVPQALLSVLSTLAQAKSGFIARKGQSRAMPAFLSRPPFSPDFLGGGATAMHMMFTG